MSLHPSYEPITVSTVAVGLTAATYAGFRTAVITVEDNAIRFRVDGSDPTASEGHLVSAGGRILLGSADEIRSFRAIRQSSSDAKLRVSYGNEGDSLGIDDSTIAGSITIGSVTVSNGDGATSVPVQGSDAHDAVAARNPVQVAGYAKSTAPADVSADGDVARLWTLRNGTLTVNLRDASGAEVAVGGGTQYDEDTASGAADKLTMAGVVRKDTAASLVDLNGDRTQLQVRSDGKLWVDAEVSSSALPTGAATAAKQDTIIGHVDGLEGLLTTIDGHVDALETDLAAVKTATQLIDDAVYADNDAWVNDTSKHQLVGGLYQSVPQAVTDGRVAPIQVDSTGKVITSVSSLPSIPAGTNNIGDVDVLTLPADPLGANADAAVTAGGAGSISGKLRQISSDISAVKTSVQLIDDAVSGTNLNVAVQTFPSLPAGNNNIGDVDLASAIPAGTNLIGSVKISDGTDIMLVDASGNIGVTDAGGSLTVDNTDISAAATSLAIIDDALVADDAAFTPATTKVVMAGATFDDVAPDSVNEGDAGALRMSANRNLYVNIRDNAGNERGLNIDANGNLTANIISGQNGVAGNTGTRGATTQRVTIATDDEAVVSLGLLDDTVFTDDTSTHTPGTTKALGIAMVADETSSDSVNEGDIGMPRMTLERFAVVTPRPTSTGEGLSIYRTLDLDETEEDIKTSAGKLYGFYAYNISAAKRYIKFYNATAANTTVGTTTPVLTFPLDAGTGALVEFSLGIPFATAICFAATTGVADADTGAPGTNDVVVNAFYV